MSRDHCCVPGCFKSGNSHPVLHGFPNPNKNPELFRSWIYAVGGEILALDNQYIYKLRRVCHGHFEEKYCCRFNRISNIAVPTINLPRQLAIFGNIAERKPLRAKQNLMMDTPSCSKAKQILPEECKETADFLLFMDDLFDSVNGSYNKNRFAKPLLGPVSPKSPHIKTWRDAKAAFSTFEFIGQNNKKESVPTIRNWSLTLDGMDDLVTKLEKEYNITSLWMRHLNQDPLENFFGAIRSYGCGNNNPTADQFESAFASLLINNLTSTHAPGANCENDDAKSLYTLLVDKECEVNKTCEIDLNDLLEIKFTPVASKSDPRVMAPLEYIGGYFIKKSKQKIWKGCLNCKKTLCSNEQKEYIKYREYASRNWLHSPNDMFIKSLSELQDISNYILKKYIDKPLLKTYTMMVATCLIDFNYVNCPAHKENLREFLIKSVIRFFIYSYCKNINKIMYGKREMDDSNDLMQMLAKTQNKKFLKYKM